MESDTKTYKMNEKQQKTTIFQNLTPQQAEACILLASGESITNVSKKLKINRTTIYQWQKDSYFKKCYNKQCEENQEEIITMLRGLRLKAVETIKELVMLGDEKTRLRAAIWIMESKLTEAKQQSNGVTIICQTQEEVELIKKLEEKCKEKKAPAFKWESEDY